MTLVTVRTDGTEKGTNVVSAVDGKPVPNVTYVKILVHPRRPSASWGISLTFDTEDVPK